MVEGNGVPERPTAVSGPRAPSKEAARRVGTGATRVRGRARAAIRPSGPPTMPISVRGKSDSVSEWHTRAVIDFCLRLGEAMLVCGASVADTTAALLRVCRAYDLTGVHVDITYTSVTLSMHRGVHRDPITVMRIITFFGTDYSRLESLHTLVRDIAQYRGEPGDVEDNLHELERIIERPNLYRRAVITAGWGVMGAGVATYLGGTVTMIIISALAIMAVDRVQLKMARLGIAAFFGQAVGAMAAASVAVVLLVLRDQFPDVEWLSQVQPGIVVASSVVVLLAGMSVVTAAQDTLDGFYLTAGARTFEVLLLTGGVVTGALIMLTLAGRLHVGLRLYSSGETHVLALLVLSAASMAGAFAVSAYCAPLTVAAAAVAGAVAGVTSHAVMVTFHGGAEIGAVVAAFVIGVCAPWVARRLHIPSIGMTTAGIMPLLPGMGVYKAIIFTLNGESGRASATAVSVALVALGLSVGVSLGSLLGRQLISGADSLTAKVVRRTVQDVGE